MRHILIVEDDEGLAHALARNFEAAGYEVVLAASTMAALAVLDSTRELDLVLTDIVMPGGQPNGFTLGRMARIKRLGIKVMFITGYDDLGIDDRSLPGKVFHKPLDIGTLVAEIDAALVA
jgi:DNA-binding response OmpR family regulator